MRIKDMMSKNIASCTPEASLHECARLMKDHDCGMIPIVEGNGQMKPVGTITDRDIACRAVAEGKNPLEMKAHEIMSKNPVTINLNDEHEDAIELMEDNQIRRLIVVNDNGECQGILSQADLALNAPEDEVAEVVQQVSRPTMH